MDVLNSKLDGGMKEMNKTVESLQDGLNELGEFQSQMSGFISQIKKLEMHLELKCQETRHNGEKLIRDFSQEHDEQITKMRENFISQLKILKKDQERLSQESNETKSFEMMDKFFKLTQEKIRGVEERLSECEFKIKYPQNISGLQTPSRITPNVFPDVEQV